MPPLPLSSHPSHSHHRYCSTGHLKLGSTGSAREAADPSRARTRVPTPPPFNLAIPPAAIASPMPLTRRSRVRKPTLSHLRATHSSPPPILFSPRVVSRSPLLPIYRRPNDAPCSARDLA
ncbi:hypothetical protein ACJRO7_005109 [Eucalyptus globulus]|uniref:Uncharacterized protein n=1 Tax=Eucalyptus globulus TaxID=34317 RepID=A0ABD3J485_EUCGL